MVAAAQIITVASIDDDGYPRPVAMMKLKDEKYMNRFCLSCGMPMPTDELFGE